MPYHRILVGTDGSATADKAVMAAAGLARQLGADLHVLTAYKKAGGGIGAVSGAAMAGSGAAEGVQTEAARQIADKAAAAWGEGLMTRLARGRRIGGGRHLDDRGVLRGRPDRGREQGHARTPPRAWLCPELSRPRRPLFGPRGEDRLNRFPRRGIRPKSCRTRGMPDTPRSVRTARTWCSSMRRWTKPSRDAAR